MWMLHRFKVGADEVHPVCRAPRSTIALEAVDSVGDVNDGGRCCFECRRASDRRSSFQE